MTDPADAFCPRCFAELQLEREVCGACGLTFARDGGVLDVLGQKEREPDAARVEEFYEASPFPGYAPGEDAATLLDRSRLSPFLVALDRAVPTHGRFLDLGCGTAQVPAFLALAATDRRVVAVDGCRASLGVASEFARRVSLSNLQLVRADLFDLPIEPGSFDVVHCRGVVHHTPDPYRSIACVARCVAPGGVVLLGFYENLARAWHRTRSRIAALRGGRPLAALDPVLRRRDIDPERQRIWIQDQYHHPLERSLPLPRVLDHLERLGFAWVRSVPPRPEPGLFDATPRPTAPALLLRRLGWLLAGLTDPDAGLVLLVARKSSADQPDSQPPC